MKQSKVSKNVTLMRRENAANWSPPWTKWQQAQRNKKQHVVCKSQKTHHKKSNWFARHDCKSPKCPEKHLFILLWLVKRLLSTPQAPPSPQESGVASYPLTWTYIELWGGGRPVLDWAGGDANRKNLLSSRGFSKCMQWGGRQAQTEKQLRKAGWGTIPKMPVRIWSCAKSHGTWPNAPWDLHIWDAVQPLDCQLRAWAIIVPTNINHHPVLF